MSTVRQFDDPSRPTAWKFGLCVVLLLSIIALTPHALLRYMRESILVGDEALWAVHLTVFFLVAGCLLMAGAMALWAFRASMDSVTRRRLGAFVDTMDYFRDGLVAVNPAGTVTGMNPAARTLAQPGAKSGCSLEQLFPCLRPRDLSQLLAVQGQSGYEVEHASMGCILRFRAHRDDDLVVVQISDITEYRQEQADLQRQAHLQMVGRLARGVAHDFNNVLCAITGYVELMRRPSGEAQADTEALDVIEREARRGAALAQRLLELSRESPDAAPAGPLQEELLQAVELLRVALGSAWTVDLDAAEDLPRPLFSSPRMQQMAVNLGLLSAASGGDPKTLRLWAGLKQTGSERDPAVARSVELRVQVGREPDAVWVPDQRGAVRREGLGVIHSVVRTMLEEVGGTLDVLTSPEGRIGFGAVLPARPPKPPKQKAPEQGGVRLSNLLMAVPPGRLGNRLEQSLDIEVTRVDTLAPFLQALERRAGFDGIVLSRDLLGDEARAVLQVTRKLQAKAGLVLLTDKRDEFADLRPGLVALAPAKAPRDLAKALQQAAAELADVAV